MAAVSDWRRIMKTLISQLIIVASGLCGAYCQTLSQPVHLVSPRYPDLARQAQIQGTVKVKAHLGPDGAVVSMEVTGGHTLLREEVERNISKWRFQPGSQDPLEISYEFRLVQPQVKYIPEAEVSFDLPSKVLVVSHPMVPIMDNVIIRPKK
jgi:TonB family protein